MKSRRYKKKTAVQIDEKKCQRHHKGRTFRNLLNETYKCAKTLSVFMMFLLTGFICSAVMHDPNRVRNSISIAELESCLADIDENTQSLHETYDRIHSGIDVMSVHSLKALENARNYETETTETDFTDGSSSYETEVSESSIDFEDNRISTTVQMLHKEVRNDTIHKKMSETEPFVNLKQSYDVIDGNTSGVKKCFSAGFDAIKSFFEIPTNLDEEEMAVVELEEDDNDFLEFDVLDRNDLIDIRHEVRYANFTVKELNYICDVLRPNL